MATAKFVLTSVALVLIDLLRSGSGFNISPQPNYVFREPSLTTYVDKVRSSYFGYSLNLRPAGVVVGAPRAQSDLPAQRKVNETGAIYRCRFSDGHCAPYYFDRLGNTQQEQSDFAYNSEKKDFQMLGGSMDGHGADGDRLVVCAPKMISELTEYYLLHGLCYVVDGTEGDAPKDIRKIVPLRAKEKQLHKDALGQYYYYMYGEQGISVHVTDDGEEILIGAPGVFNWRGTVVRYRRRVTDDAGGLSRRDSAPPGNRRPTNRHKRQIVSYVSDVPNPYFNRVKDDSYFGYAVSSGRFLGPDQKLLYVASAPQSNDQVGEVFIFEILNADSAFVETQLRMHFTFPGQQQGEYFGYSLLAEDFNGDGFPDLAIGAPLHSRTGDYESGAVYVHWNEGQLNFQLQTKLTSSYDLGGRFGTSLAKIGDINMDGYNDIAVGAPFEGNGVVYIFLGSVDGLQSKASQRLTAPTNELVWPGNAMFGHAISRGTDIDRNGYNDLAIGSPNAETVYVYRTYPVVRIEAEVSSTKRELSLEDTSFELSVCLSASFTAGLQNPVQLGYSLSVDAQLGRVTLLGSGSKYNNTVTLRDATEQCQPVRAALKATAASIYRPIVMELTYHLLAEPPTEAAASAFCTHCALLDPTLPAHVIRKISFKTGCQGEVCVSDLRLSARWLDIAGGDAGYVLGSTKKASIEFTVHNAGENAYLPQLNVTLTPARLTLAKLTSECRQTVTSDGVNVLCDLNNGLPLKASYTSKYTLILDMTKLEAGTAAEIRAEALSSSEESVPGDNFHETVLPLKEFSDIEIVGKSSVPEVHLEKQRGMIAVEYELQLHNNGPSVFRNLAFTLDVPLVYHKPSSGQTFKIINFNDIVVTGYYSYKTLDYTWTQNDTVLLPNPIVHSTIEPSPVVNVEDLHRQPSDFVLMSGAGGGLYGGWTGENSSPHEQDTISFHRRRRREAPDSTHTSPNFNRYTNQLSRQSVYPASRLSSVIDASALGLPANRTLLFSCIEDEDSVAECARLNIAVDLFRPTNVPIVITLAFQIDLDAIDEAFLEREDIFALLMLGDIQRDEPDGAARFQLSRSDPFTVVYRYSDTSTPVWVYIVSAVGGLLVLVAITYGLYRLGFFKRATKEEMEKHQRESARLNEPEPSGSRVDSETEPESNKTLPNESM